MVLLVRASTPLAVLSLPVLLAWGAEAAVGSFAGPGVVGFSAEARVAMLGGSGGVAAAGVGAAGGVVAAGGVAEERPFAARSVVAAGGVGKERLPAESGIRTTGTRRLCLAEAPDERAEPPGGTKVDVGASRVQHWLPPAPGGTQHADEA